MIFEIDRTQQWPVKNINWVLNPRLRNLSPIFAKYIMPYGMIPYHKKEVNPWRHIAVRQKHFALAAIRTDCKALDHEWLRSAGIKDAQLENPVQMHERSHVYKEAMNNCVWGT